METIILASGSPRRKELLTKVKMPVKVIPPDLTEDYSASGSAADLVARVARSKVEAVVEIFKTESPRWVLGVDTIVEVDGKVLGKPGSPYVAFLYPKGDRYFTGRPPRAGGNSLDKRRAGAHHLSPLSPTPWISAALGTWGPRRETGNLPFMPKRNVEMKKFLMESMSLA